MLPTVLLVLSQAGTVVFGGDVMLNGIPVKAKPLAALAPKFKAADLAIVNLEIPLTNSKDRTKRKTAEELKRRDQFILRGDPRHLPHLKAVGIDMVSLANNHAMDFGPGGLREMIEGLDKLGIAHAGAGRNAAEAERVAVVRAKGKRIGLVSYLAFMSAGALRKCTPATDTTAGIAVLSFGGKPDTRKIEAIVQKAKASCDILVVGLHWGIERKTKPTGYQIALGKAFLDAGADVVWGNHPHVLQPAVSVDGKPIMYSMGNLVSPLPAAAALARWTIGDAKVSLIPYRIVGGRAVTEK
ncbi:CapA family protein [soil metagenome]